MSRILSLLFILIISGCSTSTRIPSVQLSGDNPNIFILKHDLRESGISKDAVFHFVSDNSTPGIIYFYIWVEDSFGNILMESHSKSEVFLK